MVIQRFLDYLFQLTAFYIVHVCLRSFLDHLKSAPAGRAPACESTACASRLAAGLAAEHYASVPAIRSTGHILDHIVVPIPAEPAAPMPGLRRRSKWQSENRRG